MFCTGKCNSVCLRLHVPSDTKKLYKMSLWQKNLNHFYLCSWCVFQTLSSFSLVILIVALVFISNFFLFARRACFMSTIKNIYSLKSNVENYLVLIHSNQYGQMLPQQYAKTLKIYNIQTPFQNARFAHFSLENLSGTSITTLVFLTTDHL